MLLFISFAFVGVGTGQCHGRRPHGRVSQGRGLGVKTPRPRRAPLFEIQPGLWTTQVPLDNDASVPRKGSTSLNRSISAVN